MFDIENRKCNKLTPKISRQLWLQSYHVVEAHKEAQVNEEIHEDGRPLDCRPKWNLVQCCIFIVRR